MLHSGEVLGQYNVGSLIGQGGFGLVYRGEHSELGIEVAIKEYFPSELSVREDGTVHPSKPEFSEPFAEGLERFLKEAKQLERFRESPSIVTCRDFFRANGTAYMVMDYVAGLSLTSLLEQRESAGNPCTERDLLDTIQSLLTGLQTVHESGVYHRDIKPSNILVRQEDGAPVLIDFGAAKQETGKHTKSLAPYTDGYAAMEQIGDGKIGSWTDIYGIGAVMWRMVAGGAPPFLPPNPVPVQKRALAFSQEESDPLPTARELGKGRFSDGILHVIDDCLIINPQKRIQDCTELSARLGAGSVVLVEGIDQAVPVEETAETLREENIRSEESESTSRERQNKRSLAGWIFAILGLHRLAAEQGNASAQYNLALMYYIGDGVPQDYQEAVKWYRLAAEQGNDGAQDSLGWMYYNGEGVPEDYQEAVKWYRLAAEQGNASAQDSLGWMYYNGDGVPQDYQEAVKWYRLAAEQGNDGAQDSLGWMYYNGEGVPEDYQEAVKWYRLAAEQGNDGAQDSLAEMYYIGDGVPQDYQEAVKWYRLAAEQGNDGAQYKLALMYKNGDGVPQDYKEAVKWYRLAAEQGNASAPGSLGWMYYIGDGVPQDYQEAVKWFRLAAEQGNAGAQYNLALMYYNGEGVSQDYQEAVKWYRLTQPGFFATLLTLPYHQDSKEAVKWFRLAAEQGDARAQENLASMYYNGKGVSQDYQEAVKWFRLAAEQGDAWAQYKLALMYENGEGVPEDLKEAVKWYRLAAEQGNAWAQNSLASMYENGKGVPQDLKEAVKWYKLAAEQGDASAQFFLASMYKNGYGVPQDYKEAVKWYRLAAKQGNDGAQHNLALMYYNGEGVPQDYVRAHAWASIAAITGDSNSRSLKENIENRMTKQQIHEAQELAKEIFARIDS